MVGGALSVLFLTRRRDTGSGTRPRISRIRGSRRRYPRPKEMLDEFDGKIHLPVDVGLSVNTQRVEMRMSATSRAARYGT